jgi:hypothetical protein
MSGLVFARLLESQHGHSLRIHPAEQVANDTVLAGGIKRLQNHQKRLAAVRVEQILQLFHALQMSLELGKCFVMRLVLAGVGASIFDIRGLSPAPTANFLR